MSHGDRIHADRQIMAAATPLHRGAPATGAPQRVITGRTRQRLDGFRARSASSSRDNTRLITNEGDTCEPILSSAVRVAGSLAVVGGALAAGAAPADAAPSDNGAAHAGAPLSNNQAYGVAATGPITIDPVALATRGSTPAVSSGVVVPSFITTGGILDRAAYNASYSHVGSVKVQLLPAG